MLRQTFSQPQKSERFQYSCYFRSLFTHGNTVRDRFCFLSEVPNFYEFLNMLQFNLTIALDWVRNVKLIIFRIFTQLRAKDL